jgi:enoyl-CoA hydratase/carnithine racemase
MSGVDPLSSVDLKIDSNLALLTLTDSRGGNLINGGFIDTLLHHLRSLQQQKEIRAIVLRSDGSNFCLGMDLALVQSGRDIGQDQEKIIDLYVELLATIQQIPKPVLSLVNGDVRAGGVGLACACDIVLASNQATFQLGEALFGLIPANVIPFISPRRIGPAKLRYLVLTARKLSALEAYQYALVDEVLADDTREKKTKEILKNLFRASPRAVAEIKTFMGEMFDGYQNEAVPLAKRKLLELIARPDVQQAISAFQQSSTPAWFTKYKSNTPLWPVEE